MVIPMVAEYSEYKGHPLISLKRDEEDKYPFRFGVKKAQLIVDNFEEVKKFAENFDESEEEDF